MDCRYLECRVEFWYCLATCTVNTQVCFVVPWLWLCARVMSCSFPLHWKDYFFPFKCIQKGSTYYLNFIKIMNEPEHPFKNYLSYISIYLKGVGTSSDSVIACWLGSSSENNYRRFWSCKGKGTAVFGTSQSNQRDGPGNTYRCG